MVSRTDPVPFAETDEMRRAAERLAGLGVWRVGADLRLHLSPGAAAVLGLEPNAPPLPLSQFVERIDPADRAHAVAAAKRAFDLAQSHEQSLGYRRPDGEHICLRIALHPERAPDGRVTAFAGALVRAQADPVTRLTETEVQARAFVRQSPVPMCLIDHDQRFLAMSPTFEAGFRIEESAALGRKVDDEMPWMPERWRRSIRRALDGDTARSEADSYDTPGGRIRWARWVCSPWRDAYGEVQGVVVSGSDITDLVRAQAGVEISRQRMAFGMDMAEMMMVEVDLERREVFIEGDWKQFFPDAPTLRTISGEDPAIDEDGRETLARNWIAHLGGSPPYSAEYRVRLADGREIWHAANIRILRSSHGIASRAIAVIHDITDRKLAETRLREAEQRAVVAAAAKGDFLANISHEIRTPLNGVLAISELLLRTPLDDRQSEMVRLVAGSGEALLRVMDDIVEYTRIEADAIELANRPFDLESALRAACEAGRIRAEAKGLEFDCFISAGLDGVFRGDPVRIGQILSHLLNNAVKFTDQGSVRVSATAVEADTCTHVAIRVEDTGAGFDPEFAERIFERFVQADGSVSRRHGGLGLGLSIVKRLVDLMDGKVSAVSRPGEGACFEVLLPLQRDRISSLGALKLVAAEEVDVELRLDHLRVLVAEDNPMNRRVVELLLAPSGLKLDFAENGRIAVDRVMAQPYDLILMDLQMPVMGGLAATRAIREWERERRRTPMPILALSANAADVHVREALEAGADDHVAKPIVRETLLDAIARHVRVRPSADGEIDLDELDLAV